MLYTILAYTYILPLVYVVILHLTLPFSIIRNIFILFYFTLHLLLSLFIHILPSSLLNYHTLIYFSKNKYVLPYFLPLPIIQIILVNYTTLVYSPVSSTISRTLIITLLSHIFISLC